MARIRTIKPEFFSDEKLAPMSVLDRFVFIGLISMADDAGRLVDNVKSIDGFVFPDTDDTARDSLARLAAAGRILRYLSESGQKLIQVANWAKHQKVDHAAKYVLPAPSEADVTSSRDSRATLAQSSRSDLRPVPTTYDQGPTTDDRSDGDGREPDLRVIPTDATWALLNVRLPESYRPDLESLLDGRPARERVAWCARLAAHLDGMHGPVVPPDALGEAIRQFNANGAIGTRLFDGYVRRVLAPVPTGPPAGPRNVFRPGSRETAGQETYDAAYSVALAMQEAERQTRRAG